MTKEAIESGEVRQRDHSLLPQRTVDYPRMSRN